MPRSRTHLAVLTAASAGAALVLVAWLVLLLQADDGTPGERIDLGRPALGDVPDRPDDLLPPPLRAPRAGGEQRPLVPADPRRTGPLAVRGKVVDRQSRAAVVSFQVVALPHGEGSPLERIDERAVTTPFHRITGNFDVPLPAGRWDVVVRAPGYLPATFLDLELPALDWTPLVVELDTGDGIAGLAVDRADGLPLAGVKAFLHVERLDDPSAPPPRPTMAETGLDGRFSFSPLPAGQYAVSLLEPDNEVDRIGAIRVSEGRGATDVTIWMQPRHQVQLVIRDERGRPVTGARVELRGTGHIATGSTNAQGIVVLEHVPDGSFVARASRRGFADGEQPIELLGGEGHTVHWMTLETLAGG